MKNYNFVNTNKKYFFLFLTFFFKIYYSFILFLIYLKLFCFFLRYFFKLIFDYECGQKGGNKNRCFKQTIATFCQTSRVFISSIWFLEELFAWSFWNSMSSNFVQFFSYFFIIFLIYFFECKIFVVLSFVFFKYKYIYIFKSDFYQSKKL